MSNAIPYNTSELMQLGAQCVVGLAAQGTVLKITAITPAQLQSALNDFNTADTAWRNAVSAQPAISAAYTAQQAALLDYLQTGQGQFRSRFGGRWNQEWAQTGFIQPSIAVPGSIDKRMGLVTKVVACLKNNPSWQVSDLGFTSFKGGELSTAVAAARTAAQNSDNSLRLLSAARSDAYDALRSMLSSLLRMLGAVLAPDDSRWLLFGFSIPAVPSTPGQLQNVSAHLDGTGATIVAQCDALPLAKRYRWRILRVGVDPDYTLAASTVEPLAQITGVMPGQTARIIVQGVSGDRQGLASEPMEFAMPLGAAKPAIRPALALAEGASNGHGKGHGREFA